MEKTFSFRILLKMLVIRHKDKAKSCRFVWSDARIDHHSFVLETVSFKPNILNRSLLSKHTKFLIRIQEIQSSCIFRTESGV